MFLPTKTPTNKEVIVKMALKISLATVIHSIHKTLGIMEASSITQCKDSNRIIMDTISEQDMTPEEEIIITILPIMILDTHNQETTHNILPIPVAQHHQEATITQTPPIPPKTTEEDPISHQCRQWNNWTAKPTKQLEPFCI